MQRDPRQQHHAAEQRAERDLDLGTLDLQKAWRCRPVRIRYAQPGKSERGRGAERNLDASVDLDRPVERGLKGLAGQPCLATERPETGDRDAQKRQRGEAAQQQTAQPHPHTSPQRVSGDDSGGRGSALAQAGSCKL